MYEIIETREYWTWFEALRNWGVRHRIQARLRRLALGNLGDFESVGDGLFELRMDFGPGYRVYFTRRGKDVIVLLGGRDKLSQARDIARAKILSRTLLEEREWAE